MGKLSSRFTFNQPGGMFHSTDIVKSDSNIGSTSAESYEKRREIEKNRQHVAGYRNAQVLHSYRQTARETVQEGKVSNERPRTSRIEHQSTSRIENVSTSRRESGVTSIPSRPTKPSTSFREPQNRGYNPFG